MYCGTFFTSRCSSTWVDERFNIIGLKKKGEESEDVKEEIVNEALERIKCTRQTSLWLLTVDRCRSLPYRSCWSRWLACATHGGGRKQFFSSSTPFAFQPLRGYSGSCPHILAWLEGIKKSNKKFFLRKLIFARFFCFWRPSFSCEAWTNP